MPETHRLQLPAFVTEELRQMIVHKSSDGNFTWNKKIEAVSQVSVLVGSEQLRLFCPILPAIIYILKEYSLRTKQALWLDSGELDALVYDFTTKMFVPNPIRSGNSRSMGVLQNANVGTSSGEPQLVFQVAFDKSSWQKRNRLAYVIPYLPPVILWMIQEVLCWQRTYGPPPIVIKMCGAHDAGIITDEAMKPTYPAICPLFRYPRNGGCYPPSYNQLNHFWGTICRLYDQENERWENPKTGTIGRRPGAIKLSRAGKGKLPYRVDPIYTLHSLRLGGVTSLRDAGMPLAVVAGLAGHRSFEMSRYYRPFADS